MSAPDRWARVRTVLEELVGQPADERPAYLAAHITEGEIRVEVESCFERSTMPETSWSGRQRPAETARRRNPLLRPSFSLARGSVRSRFWHRWVRVGMGQVYRARDTRLDRAVAVKVIAPISHTPLPAVSASNGKRARFQN